jgi:hypothetical protein
MSSLVQLTVETMSGDRITVLSLLYFVVTYLLMTTGFNEGSSWNFTNESWPGLGP